MDERKWGLLSLYAVVYGLAALVAFRLGDVVPVPTVYVLLGLLYLVPIWLATTRRLGHRLGAVLLVVTPLLPALVVVDPLEVGFYGYDPYVTLQTALGFRADGPIEVARGRFAWPGFYSLLWVVVSATGLPVETVGKYLPLIAVLAPLFLYLFARRVVSNRTAFVAAMGFAGVRTLYAFQIKFVDETPAFLLFFALLFLLGIRSSSRSSAVSYLALLVALGAVLNHHYVGALVCLLLIAWDLSGTGLPRPRGLPELRWPFSRLTLTSTVVFVAMFLVVAPQFVGFLASVADLSPSITSETIDSARPPGDGTTAASSGQTGPGGEPSGSPEIASTDRTIPLRFWQLVAANVVLLAVLSVAVVRYRSWALESRPALLVAGVLGAVLALGYGYSVALGPVIPLDPSRYLLYMIGLLLVPAGFALERTDRARRPTAIFATLAVLVVVTQMSLVPPAVMYSSQEQTIVGEGHYSPSQFAAGEWVAEYDGTQVVGWERGLWIANGVDRLEFGAVDVDCSVLRVWRADAPTDPRRPTDSVVYSNGRLDLYRCTE